MAQRRNSWHTLPIQAHHGLRRPCRPHLASLATWPHPCRRARAADTWLLCTLLFVSLRRVMHACGCLPRLGASTADALALAARFPAQVP